MLRAARVIRTHLQLKHTTVTHSEGKLIVAILVLAALLRLWDLGSNPPGVIPDEAEFGYAAYSIIHTGTTSYGNSNPLLFYAPGDYYPPLYTYILIPLVWLFGLSITIVRLPSAVFGIISCIFVYILIRQLYRSRLAALAGALLMAINPWSLFYSRQGRFEMIGLALVLAGVIAFIYAISKGSRKSIIWSAALLGLSLFANDSTKIVVPLLAGALCVYAWPQLRMKRRRLYAFAGVFTLFLVLTAKVVFIDGQIGDYTQAAGSLTSELAVTVNEERRFSDAPQLIKTVFHNKATVLAHRYLTEFVSVFSVDWLFVNGHGHPQESIGRYGQYLLFELPLFFIGLTYMWKRKRESMLLVFWLLAAHIPGAVTSGRFFPYRSILMLPVPIIISSVGADTYVAWVSQMSRRQRIAIGSISAFIICSVTAGFLSTYFYEFPVYSSEWRYKEKTDALRYAIRQEATYEHIFIAGQFESTYAFMSGLDPKLYANAVSSPKNYNDIPTVVLGKYTFGSFPVSSIATPSAYFPPDSLVIADTVPDGVEPIRKFVGTEPLRPVYVAFDTDP